MKRSVRIYTPDASEVLSGIDQLSALMSPSFSSGAFVCVLVIIISICN